MSLWNDTSTFRKKKDKKSENHHPEQYQLQVQICTLRPPACHFSWEGTSPAALQKSYVRKKKNQFSTLLVRTEHGSLVFTLRHSSLCIGVHSTSHTSVYEEMEHPVHRLQLWETQIYSREAFRRDSIADKALSIHILNPTLVQWTLRGFTSPALHLIPWALPGYGTKNQKKEWEQDF